MYVNGRHSGSQPESGGSIPLMCSSFTFLLFKRLRGGNSCPSALRTEGKFLKKKVIQLFPKQNCKCWCETPAEAERLMQICDEQKIKWRSGKTPMEGLHYNLRDDAYPAWIQLNYSWSLCNHYICILTQAPYIDNGARRDFEENNSVDLTPLVKSEIVPITPSSIMQEVWL